MEVAQPSKYPLSENNELRIEVGNDDVTVELIEGAAELFGTELVRHKRYIFPPGFRCSIFTYEGALIEIFGSTESAYIACQTPMILYLNTHAGLEKLRRKAFVDIENGVKLARGPRIIIAGPTDVGKSTLARILLNYAVRQNHTPIFVDLDPGQGQISIPGTVAALHVTKPADIFDGFDRLTTLSYNFGMMSVAENTEYYIHLIQKLAETVDSKCERSSRISSSGVVINTCGFIKDSGYTSLLAACKAFRIDVAVILDNEKLYNLMREEMPRGVRVVHQPKSGGIEARSQAARIRARKMAIRRYFYGTSDSPYNPFNVEIPFESSEESRVLTIAKVGTERLPDSCLPFGMVQEDHRTKVVKVPFTPDLKNHVLALMPPHAVLDQSLISIPVMGYVVVTDVDMQRKTLTLLSPQPQPLPSKLALFSDVTFVDDS